MKRPAAAGKAKGKASATAGKAKAKAKATASKAKVKAKAKSQTRGKQTSEGHDNEVANEASEDTVHYSEAEIPEDKPRKTKTKTKPKAKPTQRKQTKKAAQDAEAEKKARYSRKSSAYHCAKAAALKAGSTVEEATVEAKKVS